MFCALSPLINTAEVEILGTASDRLAPVADGGRWVDSVERETRI